MLFVRSLMRPARRRWAPAHAVQVTGRVEAPFTPCPTPHLPVLTHIHAKLITVTGGEASRSHVADDVRAEQPRTS